MMPPPTPPAIVSQSFAQRAARIAQRISDDVSKNLIPAAAQPLYAAELAAARAADAKSDRNAPVMLDQIERQLAPLDFTLSRANDGQSIVVHVGDDVKLAMNDTNMWDAAISDNSVLVRPVGVMFVRGTQGIWNAKKPGTVTITATQRGGTASVMFTVVVLPKA